MMGTTKDKCIGIVLSEILPDCEETRKYFREFIRGGYKLVGGESHEISKTGEEKYFSNSFTATIINDMIIEAWGTQTDITERKQAEEELKTKMKQLEIFNDASVGRELRMLELKKEINELLAKLGKEPKYEIPL